MNDHPTRRRGRRAAAAALVVVSLSPVAAAGSAAAVPAARAATASTAGVAVSERAGLPSWWYDAMRLEAAHRVTTGKGVTVAVIDVAVDPTAADIRGVDLTLRTDCRGEKVRPAGPEIGDHGTAMVTNLAGTGRGNGPGGRGVRGIAPGVKVLFYGMDTDVSTPFEDCDVFDGARLFRRATDDGADIITTSLAWNGQARLRAAVRYAVSHGVVVVGASGDRKLDPLGGPPAYPAAEDGAISVNAVDRKALPWRDNPRPYFLGDHQVYPVIAAPGVAVDSSGYEDGRGWVSGGTRTGTSDAAPIVAGALALVKAKYPDATGNQLVQHLIHHPSRGAYGWDGKYGFGVVSVTEMLAQDPTGWPDVNPLTRGPRYALRTFPDSVYGAAASSSPEPSATADPSHAPAPTDDGAQQQAGGPESDGAPGWLWPVAALLALGAVGLAFVRRQTRRRTPASLDPTEEV